MTTSTATPTREQTQADEDDGVKWLAILIRQGLLLICSGIERHYGLRRESRN